MDILYGVKLVVLTELDPATELAKGGGVVCRVDTAEEAELTGVFAKGEEKVQRTDDKILAVVNTDDLLYGYDLKLKDNTFNVNIMGLLEGGTIRKTGEVINGYDTPMMASGSLMKMFKAEIYVANYEGNSIVNYTKITLNKCKGKVDKLVYKSDFFAPEFTIDAREATKASKPIKNIDYVSSLPAADVTAPVLTMVTTAAITKPAVATGKANKLGGLWFVASAATIDSMGDLSALVNMGMGTYATISIVDTNTNLVTSTLAAGKYKMYATDLVGNISAASVEVTLS